MVLINMLEIKAPQKRLIQFGRGNTLTIKEAANICHKTPATIKRWMQEGWPKGYEDLIRLHAQGKIIPESWTHTRFCLDDLIHLEGVGEVGFQELSKIRRDRIAAEQRERTLFQKHAKLELAFEEAKTKISNLKSMLDKPKNKTGEN